MAQSMAYFDTPDTVAYMTVCDPANYWDDWEPYESIRMEQKC